MTIKSLTEMVFKTKKGQVGAVQFDAMVSENHTMSAEVTEHPVEEGSDIADHIRIGPREIEIVGVISNTPVVLLSSVKAESPIEGDTERVVDRVNAAHKRIKKTMEEGLLVQVVTSLETYPDDMAIISYGVTRDADKGNILEANLVLRQIQISYNEVVEVAIAEPEKVSSKKKKPKGKKTKKPATPKQIEKGRSNVHRLLWSK
ncbi:MAG: hypothetical protein GY847_14925 [Proteobacteria bacterium]|nr:hypothetical protein [Pseudomonadota bacterium]